MHAIDHGLTIRTLRHTRWMGLAIALVAVSSCGSSGASGSGATSAPSAVAAASSTSAAAVSTRASTGSAAGAATTAGVATSGAAASSSALARSICEIIRAVPADLLPDAAPAAYQAQFVLKAVGVLSTDDLRAIHSGDLDAPVLAACPTEYGDFLRRGEITALSSL